MHKEGYVEGKMQVENTEQRKQAATETDNGVQSKLKDQYIKIKKSIKKIIICL